MIKLLIFDLDGTLIDSAPDIVWCANEMLRSRGLEPLPEEQIVASIGEGFRQLVFRIVPETHANANLHNDLSNDFYRIYENHLLDRTKPYPGIEGFLDEWKGQIAIVTNKPSHLADKTVKGLGLDRRSWVRVFGADSLPNRKPDPLPLLECMKAAGVERHETLMIGDGIPDMISARRAGVHSIACEYGYTSREILAAQGASLFVREPRALSEVVSQAERLPPREILLA